MKLLIFSWILLFFSFLYLCFFSEVKVTIGYAYSIVKNRRGVSLFHEHNLIIKNNVKRVILENGLVFGEFLSAEKETYFVTIGSHVTFYETYSEMLEVASVHGVEISESKYINFMDNSIVTFLQK